MKEILFSIDETTGELTMRIDGVAGKACAPIAELVEGFFGKATTDAHTAEWYAKTEVVPVVTPRKG